MNDILTLLALAAAGSVAGVMNVVAGGGSLLSIPLLIFFGLPPTVANGTNRVAILCQDIGATASFHRKGLVPWRWLKLAAPAAVVGAGLGSWTAVSVGDEAFRRLLALVMILAALLLIWRPAFVDGGRKGKKEASRKGPKALSDQEGISDEQSEGSRHSLPKTPPLPVGGRRVLAILGFFVLGFYGGLVQAGIGFLALGILSALGVGLITANALKVALILMFTPLTIILFALNDAVDWTFGIALALGNFLGGLLGVHLQVLKGSRWVRGFVTATVVVFALRLALME